MVNRWQGNTGKRVRIEEPGDRAPHPERPQEKPSAPPVSTGRAPLLPPFLSGGLGSVMNKFGELETEDIILLLILYLLYRESGDSELLMILGGMFLL